MRPWRFSLAVCVMWAAGSISFISHTHTHTHTLLLLQKYRITKRVGGGSFGDIYLGTSCKSELCDQGTRSFSHLTPFVLLILLSSGVGANGEKVAVKFEKHGARCPQLRHEYKVYRELQNAPGFAKVHYFGTQDSVS